MAQGGMRKMGQYNKKKYIYKNLIVKTAATFLQQE